MSMPQVISRPQEGDTFSSQCPHCKVEYTVKRGSLYQCPCGNNIAYFYEPRMVILDDRVRLEKEADSG